MRHRLEKIHVSVYMQDLVWSAKMLLVIFKCWSVMRFGSQLSGLVE
jgi:hypothetical protein